MILLSSPLKNDPLETTVSIFFSLEIEIFTTKMVNSKSLKKPVVSFCRRWTSLIKAKELLKSLQSKAKETVQNNAKKKET